MPKLPEPTGRSRQTDITTDRHAQAVANVLFGGASSADLDLFATVVRTYLREDADERKHFLMWFEALPKSEEPARGRKR